ncbi:alpha-amylase family protein [Polaromonas hydrogenivorans]|uniref:Alpha-amylase family protein n=1 Tax=Polaromonas hydrogenivorans TaxID=335476 RepID=A0AAU7LZ68_9BURK
MEPRWFEKQLRIQQFVMRETDILDYDVEGVVRHLKETHTNCFVTNAGGVVDFFRHDLEIANPNRFMGEHDILAEITQACHAAGIKVMVRVDFRGVEKRHYDLHPDWFAVDENGRPIQFEWQSEPLPDALYAPCYLSYYRNEHAFRFTHALLSRYAIDGIWENAPMQVGACYCRRCTESFRSEFGKELPRGGDFNNARYDEYRAWKARNLLAHLKNYRAEVKKYGEDKAFCAEIFGLFHESYRKLSADLYAIKHAMDFTVTPLFVAKNELLHAPSTLIKFLGAMDSGKTPVILTGHLGMDNQYRYVSGAPAEVRLWMWQAVSAGGSLWNTTFNGQHPAKTHDRRNAFLVADIYAFMEENEALLHGQQPEAAVAILYSQKSSFQFSDSNRASDRYLTHIIGMEQALLDEHIQYRFICDFDLNSEALEDVRLLVLSNAAVLTDREIEVIRAFVAGGGRLLATHHTSLWNEQGEMCSDFALADVFGCHFTGIEKDSSRWGYQRVAAEHPVTAGLELTELIANGGTSLLVRKDNASVAAPLTYVPGIYPQPPEKSWLPSLRTDYPTALVNPFGEGECIYFATPIDRNVGQHGHPDFSQVLGNAVRYLLNGANPLSTDAPPSLQFALTRARGQAGVYLLHAVNLTSAPRRPIKTLVPVADVRASLRLPGLKLKSFAQLRTEGKDVKVSAAIDAQLAGLEVSVVFSQILEYVCIKLEVE